MQPGAVMGLEVTDRVINNRVLVLCQSRKLSHVSIVVAIFVREDLEKI